MAGFKDCKSGREELQIGEALWITNRGRDLKSVQILQTGAREISNRGRTK